jgi:RNA polymerase-binding transcription factor DksA
MTSAVLAEPPMFANGAGAAMPMHMADIATDTFEREFTLSLMESTDQTLDQIEEALERIEDGVYGVCRACEGKIPKVRLNAIPHTRRATTWPPQKSRSFRQLWSGSVSTY